MTSRLIDSDLLGALERLDAACDARSIVADPQESVVEVNGTPELAIAITLRPMVGTGRPVTVRAPYNDQTADWIKALALRVRSARRWEPEWWARQAVADVLGTVDGTAEDVAQVAELPAVPHES